MPARSMVAHLHGDVREGGRVRLRFKLDKSGQAVAMALPAEGHAEHGRRSATARDDLRSEVPPRADHRRPHRRRPGDGEGVVGGGRQRSSSSASPMPGSRSPAWTRCARSSASRSCRSTSPTPNLGHRAAPSRIGGAHRHHRSTRPSMSAPAAWSTGSGLTVAREEMDIRYFGLTAAGPGLRPGAALSRRRRRQFGRRLRQSPVRSMRW